MRFSDNPDYGFAIGRVRARESKFLKRSDFDKIIESQNENDLLTIIKDRDLLQSSEKELPTLSQLIEHLLKINFEENQSFFSRYCLNPTVKALFLNTALNQTQRINTILATLDNEFINQYFITAFDLENMRNFVRMKYFAERENHDVKIQSNRYTAIYLKAGSIELSIYIQMLSEDWDGVLRWVRNTKYQSCIEDGINYLLNQKSFRRLERRIEEEKQKLLYQTRFTTFGYEPLVGYYLFRDTELRNLKQVFYGIIANTPSDEIRESIAWIL